MASSIIQLPKLILKVAGILLTTISPVLADSADTKNEKDGGFYFTLGVGTHHLQNEKAKAGPDSAVEDGRTIVDIFDKSYGLETGIGFNFKDIRTEVTYKLLDNELRSAYLGNLGNTTSASGSVDAHLIY